MSGAAKRKRKAGAARRRERVRAKALARLRPPSREADLFATIAIAVMKTPDARRGIGSLLEHVGRALQETAEPAPASDEAPKKDPTS